ncbi:MAG TPA: hypothetical protein VHT96_04540 [Clostridia bacterium]|nr:hypothetical protein [Clostridia bacterium]
MKLRLIVFILIAVLLSSSSSCSNTVRYVSTSGQIGNDHLVLGSIEYVKKIQDIAVASGNRKALSVIMADVDKYGSDLDQNSSDNSLRFCKLICSIISRIGYVDMKTHYFRNKLNRAPKSLQELIRINSTLPLNKRWILLSIGASCYHIQGTDGEYNMKFISYNGFCEAVYNKKGVLLTENNDPVNMGTFNYAAGIRSINAHIKYDISPYIKWGNTADSPQKGSMSINKGVNSALINYKKHSASVYIFRETLFGMQQGRVP